MFEKSTNQFATPFLRFYTLYSIHVALAIWCFYRGQLWIYEQKSDTNLDVMLFLGCIAVYNLLKYPDFRGFKPHRQSKTHFFGYLLTLFCLIISIFTYVNAPPVLQIKLLFSGVGVLLYPILRPFGVWKMFVVAFVVSWTCVGVPLFESLPKIVFINAVLSASLILWIWLIPFEIYDRKTDQLRQPTIAQRLSINQFKIMGLLSLLIWFLWNVQTKNTHIPLYIITVLTCLSLLASNEKRNYYFTALGVESLPILWYLSLIIFQHE
jgi:hypothetical protein